jgi:hypothetical protein
LVAGKHQDEEELGVTSMRQSKGDGGFFDFDSRNTSPDPHSRTELKGVKNQTAEHSVCQGIPSSPAKHFNSHNA